MLGGAHGLAVLAVAVGVSCSKVETKRPAVETRAPVSPVFGAFQVAPASGSGRQQTFLVTLSRTADSPVPAMIGLLVTAGDGSNACYVFHVVARQDTLLVNDSGSGSKSMGGTAGVSNSQCEAGRTASEVTAASVTVRFPMKFRPEFRGSKTVQAIAQDDAGDGTGLRKAGTYTVE